jgi:hypothetical protein
MVLVATPRASNATVRRTAFALLPVMLLMVVFQRHQLRGSQPALFLRRRPRAISGHRRRRAGGRAGRACGASSSLMGRHMFAKAALIDAPPAPPSNDRVRAALDEHLQVDYAPIREFLASAPADLRAVLAIYYETCLQGGCVDRSRALMPDMNEAQQTETLGAAAMARIRRAPLAFAQLTAMNYLSLWTVDRLRHPDRAAALTAFIASHRPMPFEELAFSLDPGETLAFQGSPRVRYMQWAIGIVGDLDSGDSRWSGIVAALLIPRLPPLFTIAAVSALAAHSCLLLTALLASGFSRIHSGRLAVIVMAAVSSACGRVLPARVTAR